jgi:hypothetical protein
MKEIMCVGLTVFIVLTNVHLDVTEGNIIAAINDNGCATQTTIEVKPPVYSMWPNWSE